MNSTEIRRILINGIVSVNDTNNVSEDLGFKHTLTGALKPYNMHLTSSMSLRDTDILTQEHFNTLFQDRRETIPTTNLLSSDSTEQVYLVEVPTGYKVATGSVSFSINGLEMVLKVS